MTDDAYVIRLRERPERWVYELLVLRRAGPGQVEYLHPYPDDKAHGGIGWVWKRTDPGMNLEPQQGVIAELPPDALPALRDALIDLCGPRHDTAMVAAAEAKAEVYRMVWQAERQRVDELMDRLAAPMVQLEPVHVREPGEPT